jgi:hypothetical protein
MRMMCAEAANINKCGSINTDNDFIKTDFIIGSKSKRA